MVEIDHYSATHTDSTQTRDNTHSISFIGIANCERELIKQTVLLSFALNFSSTLIKPRESGKASINACTL